MKKPSIIWFRQDLRLEDQPTLRAALEKGGSIIPLFIWSPEEEKKWRRGASSQWWLYHALKRLQRSLAHKGVSLLIRKGDALQVIAEIVKETGADALFFNRCYEPAIVKRDSLLQSQLHNLGVGVESFNGSLLFDPWTILTKQYKPYQVFTHFWNYCLRLEEPSPPIVAPATLPPLPISLTTASVEDLHLLPEIPWDQGLADYWNPSGRTPLGALEHALENIVGGYAEARDLLAVEGTSTLSPYLHFGELSPRMVWHAVRTFYKGDSSGEVFLRQLGWRDFAYYLLFHFPHMPEQALRTQFSDLSWETNPSYLMSWKKGVTGYPVVDAAMRQLWHTGWMHNRARMIVGSFLVKDLLIDWREGEAWFWDTLVDADLANNSMGWQWVTGCGVDAAPYFRVFNPITQGEKFDPEGVYIRRWVPELSRLPTRWIHCPWEAPPLILHQAGVRLGENYPEPIVNHAEARIKYLEAMKKGEE